MKTIFSQLYCSLNPVSVLFSAMLLSTTINAQADLSQVSVKFGLIRNYQESLGESGYEAFTLFPEIEIGGDFFLEDIKWGVSFGFWNNEIEPGIFRDYFPNSYKSFVVAPKLYYSFANLSPASQGFNASIFAGISYQVVKTSPLYPYDVFGIAKDEKTNIIVEPILGSQFGYAIKNNFIVSGEIAFHLMSRNANDIHQVEIKILIKYII